jgi:hypothetical protein
VRRSGRGRAGLTSACLLTGALVGIAGCSSPSAGVSGATPASRASAPSAQSATRLAVSPWVDLDAVPVPDLGSLVAQGTTTVNAGFVTAAKGACRPAWGGATAIDGPPAALVRRFRDAGGAVRVSFGGAEGLELARACTTSAEIAAAYMQVIEALGVRLVDLDVEGAALRDAASVHRRNEALARVAADAEQRGQPLRISYTLPVETRGLAPAAVALLRDAHAVGVPLDTVDLLAMDYAGDGDVVTATDSAVRNAATQLADLEGKGRVALAVTVMIGLSDLPGQVLPLADVARLVAVVRGHGAAWLGFWSLGRDRACTREASVAQPVCSGVAQQPGDFTRAFRAASG